MCRPTGRIPTGKEKRQGKERKEQLSVSTKDTWGPLILLVVLPDGVRTSTGESMSIVICSHALPILSLVPPAHVP